MTSKYGIATSKGLGNFIDSDSKNEIVLAIGKMDYSMAPVYQSNFKNCYSGYLYHAPVVMKLEKLVPGTRLKNSWRAASPFIDAYLVVGDSKGHPVGWYGDTTTSQIRPDGWPASQWTEDETSLTIKYLMVGSSSENSWNSSAHMSGTVYAMLIGRLPEQQVQPEYGLQLYGSDGQTVNFNSHYMPSNPRYMLPLPSYNINDYRQLQGFETGLTAGAKMVSGEQIARSGVIRSSSSFMNGNHYMAFSEDGTRYGARPIGWPSLMSRRFNTPFDIHPDKTTPIVRVWSVDDYF
ncbi:hypothetical protein [Vibrio sp. SCSIO 43136]|uniref:hypothetical protein n=1 Tax=Vibrio sp. SCSIO 43136 TaxID=2819101 RepID=UPI002075B6E5|nr:hypothetical protein [Vibrio sp. SCSIO 43136]USD68144.1 hypothetical protein J4N39_18390 [Vibrio sp. SCSIO 43136]